MNMKRKNEVLDVSFEFALQVISFCELLEEQKKYVVARQLLKSGTSIGANIRESQNSESKQDFIHKLKVAAKEADETQYWIELCNASEHYPNNTTLLLTLESIQKLLNSIISKTKKQIIN